MAPAVCAKSVSSRRKIGEARRSFTRRPTELEAEEAHALDREDRRERREGDGAVLVAEMPWAARPDEADLELGAFVDHRAQAGSRLGGRVYIRDRRWNSVERRLQQMREAQKLGLNVEWGCRVALDIEPGHAVRDQRLQVARDQEYGPRATLL